MIPDLILHSQKGFNQLKFPLGWAETAAYLMTPEVFHIQSLQSNSIQLNLWLKKHSYWVMCILQCYVLQSFLFQACVITRPPWGMLLTKETTDNLIFKVHNLTTYPKTIAGIFAITRSCCSWEQGSNRGKTIKTKTKFVCNNIIIIVLINPILRLAKSCCKAA